MGSLRDRSARSLYRSDVFEPFPPRHADSRCAGGAREQRRRPPRGNCLRDQWVVRASALAFQCAATCLSRLISCEHSAGPRTILLRAMRRRLSSPRSPICAREPAHISIFFMLRSLECPKNAVRRSCQPVFASLTYGLWKNPTTIPSRPSLSCRNGENNGFYGAPRASGVRLARVA